MVGIKWNTQPSTELPSESEQTSNLSPCSMVSFRTNVYNEKSNTAHFCPERFCIWAHYLLEFMVLQFSFLKLRVKITSFGTEIPKQFLKKWITWKATSPDMHLGSRASHIFPRGPCIQLFFFKKKEDDVFILQIQPSLSLTLYIGYTYNVLLFMCSACSLF